MQVKQGRPANGFLSSFPSSMVSLIKQLRVDHPGWGASFILYEMTEKHGYSYSDLPDVATVNRYFKQIGLIPKRIPQKELPSLRSSSLVRYCHDLWEMDAQGAVKTIGLDYVVIINIKDTKSKAYIMSFPVMVRTRNHQPKTKHYQWALRLAFIEWGLPKVIQVDKDSVFYPNSSGSPFPTLFHLWLLSLGIQLNFIEHPPPIENAMVERAHQTIDRQVLKGQSYSCWKQLWMSCQERRNLLNRIQVNPHAKSRPALVAFPNAIKNRRKYQIEKESEQIQLKKVYKYLSECDWYRTTSKDKTFSLANKVYYLKTAKPKAQMHFRFSNRSKKLICRDANEQIIDRIPLKGITIFDIMGNTQNDIIKTYKKIGRSRNFPIES